MTRALLKIALPILLVFVAVISLMRARPYDGAALHAALAPSENCAAPCFMAITAGETAADKAITLLHAHPWVKAVDTSQPSFINWTWSGEQPAYINETQPGRLIISEGHVARIVVATAFAFGDFWLAWGAPSDYRVTLIETVSARKSSSKTVYYSVGYHDAALAISGQSGLCRRRSLWQAAGQLEMGEPPKVFYSFDSGSLVGAVAVLKRANCGL